MVVWCPVDKASLFGHTFHFSICGLVLYIHHEMGFSACLYPVRDYHVKNVFFTLFFSPVTWSGWETLLLWLQITHSLVTITFWQNRFWKHILLISWGNRDVRVWMGCGKKQPYETRIKPRPEFSVTASENRTAKSGNAARHKGRSAEWKRLVHTKTKKRGGRRWGVSASSGRGPRRGKSEREAEKAMQGLSTGKVSVLTVLSFLFYDYFPLNVTSGLPAVKDAGSGKAGLLASKLCPP